ncbi:MAG: hypothetical protein LC667_09770 [Thioalkalivibrio sp.]|nr:hypothetical protein [Thioalkalivibrio sp.]
MLGVAFVGGLLAANMVSGGRSSRNGSSDTFSGTSPNRTDTPRETSDTWNRVRSGLGVAAVGVAMDAISKALPGIKENVIEPIRAAIHPEEKLPFPDRRINGSKISSPQGNGYSA